MMFQCGAMIWMIHGVRTLVTGLLIMAIQLGWIVGLIGRQQAHILP
jgi:hypothetical protein